MPPYTLRCAIILKRMGISYVGDCVYDLVPPWGLVYDIKKDVQPPSLTPDPAYTLRCL